MLFMLYIFSPTNFQNHDLINGNIEAIAIDCNEIRSSNVRLFIELYYLVPLLLMLSNIKSSIFLFFMDFLFHIYSFNIRLIEIPPTGYTCKSISSLQEQAHIQIKKVCNENFNRFL